MCVTLTAKQPRASTSFQTCDQGMPTKSQSEPTGAAVNRLHKSLHTLVHKVAPKAKVMSE